MSHQPPYVAASRAGANDQWLKPLPNPWMRVTVHPGGQGFKQNLIFDKSWIINSGWCDAQVALRQRARSQGIDIGTADILPIADAHAVVFINLPAKRSLVEQVRLVNPHARIVLIASESPVVQPHAVERVNHRLFDLVFTLRRLNGDPRKYQRLPPGCAFVPTPPADSVPFHERRFAILVNSNMNGGLLRSSRPWQVFQQAMRIRTGGWTLSPQRMLQVALGSRYHLRRSFARAAEQLGIEDFDIYGQGWEPLRSGWFYRLFPERPWRHWRGPLRNDKLATLCHYRFAFCYENYSGDEGYISEKIFDALAAGTVPLCLGDRHLKDWIPSDCAVFRENYRSERAMLQDLLNWDEQRWQACREAGQQFLHSQRIAPFLADAYAEQVLQGLKAVVAPAQ